jgi:hypothetical protein
MLVQPKQNDDIQSFGRHAAGRINDYRAFVE